MNNIIKHLTNQEIFDLNLDILTALPLMGNHYAYSSITKGGLSEGVSLWLDRTDKVPYVRSFIQNIIGNNRPGRAYIYNLPAGAKIDRHSDTNNYHNSVNRYHIYLDIPVGVTIVHNGPEIIPNTVVKFDLSSPHSYTNSSNRSLVFIVYDIFK